MCKLFVLKVFHGDGGQEDNDSSLRYYYGMLKKRLHQNSDMSLVLT